MKHWTLPQAHLRANLLVVVAAAVAVGVSPRRRVGDRNPQAPMG